MRHVAGMTLSNQSVLMFLVPALPSWKIKRAGTKIVPGTLPNGKGKNSESQVHTRKTPLVIKTGVKPE